MIFIVLLGVGAFAGLAAGLFGIGGGLIVVPALITVLGHELVAEPPLTHLAVGTSLATVAITAGSSAWFHHRRKAVVWPTVGRLAPVLTAGAIVGVALAQYLPGSWLRTIFGTFEIAIAARLALSSGKTSLQSEPRGMGTRLAAFIIGVLSATLGIGGGTMMTPLLLWLRKSIHQSIATASACSVPIAAIGTLGFAITGYHSEGLPPWSTGYVYWPAVIGITVASLTFARLGVRIAHSIVSRRLITAYAILLVILGTKMLLNS